MVLGYAGQLHLGIAAFFGIGAFVTGILRVDIYPFQFGFWLTFRVAVLVVTSLLALVLSSPTLALARRLPGAGDARLRRHHHHNAPQVRRNHRAACRHSIRSRRPSLPDFLHGPLRIVGHRAGLEFRTTDYSIISRYSSWPRSFCMLRNLERSRLGRAWLAIREDELAATCMGINAARLKLAAFVLSAAIAGLAGCLYATRGGGTAAPTFYDFQLSATILCAVILGGLANRSGVLLGVFFISGFEYLFAPILDGFLQSGEHQSRGKELS